MSVPSRQVGTSNARGSARSGAPSQQQSGNLAVFGIVVLAIALVWAGTHELGALYADRPHFSSFRWLFSLGLIASAGFVFANAIRPVDVRAPIDWRRVVPLIGPQVLFLAYCWVSLEFQIDNQFLNTMLAWASPFGHGLLALMVGLGIAAGMPTRR